MSDCLYLDGNDIDFCLDFIYSSLDDRKKDPVPDYKNDRGGIPFKEYLALLERVKENYNPDVLDKATFLLINVNKRQWFSNGNKRLSLMTAFLFLTKNNYIFKDYPNETVLLRCYDYYPNSHSIISGCLETPELLEWQGLIPYLLPRFIAETEQSKDFDKLKRNTRDILNMLFYNATDV